MNKTAFTVIMVFGVALAGFLEHSCANHDFPTYTPCDESAQVSFQANVKPIITTKCAITDCHNGTNDLPNWNDFDVFQEHSRNGLVKYNVIHRIMPKAGSTAGPLSQEEINTIACWIDRGANDN